MRLHVDCWSPSSRTALELIPGRRVRATASYFRAGHLLLDSLTHALQPERQTQAVDLPAGDQAETDTVRPGSLARAEASMADAGHLAGSKSKTCLQ